MPVRSAASEREETNMISEQQVYKPTILKRQTENSEQYARNHVKTMVRYTVQKEIFVTFFIIRLMSACNKAYFE